MSRAAYGRYVAIEQDGRTQVHAVNHDGGTYATLCGMDGDDSRVGQKKAPLDIGARINCPQCQGIIMFAKKYNQKDFERE